MSFTVNIYYTGKNGSAKEFAREMTESGLVNKIRAEEGNERYEYFFCRFVNDVRLKNKSQSKEFSQTLMQPEGGAKPRVEAA